MTSMPTPLPSAYADVSDEEIAQRVMKGDVLLFEVLMRRNNARVYRTIRALIRDEAEVEDLMQASYLRAYASLSTFRGGSRFSTWLMRIAYNEALGRLRSERRHPAVSLSVVEEPAMPASSTASSPESSAARKELAGVLERAVDALPDIYRTVFMLREIDGLDTAEAAGVLDVTEEVVKTRLSRARAALREKLEELVGGSAPEAFGFHAVRCDRVVAAVMRKLVD